VVSATDWLPPAALGGTDSEFHITISILEPFFGWLFLLGRDAFDAIAVLIKEMDEVV